MVKCIGIITVVVLVGKVILGCVIDVLRVLIDEKSKVIDNSQLKKATYKHHTTITHKEWQVLSCQSNWRHTYMKQLKIKVQLCSLVKHEKRATIQNPFPITIHYSFIHKITICRLIIPTWFSAIASIKDVLQEASELSIYIFYGKQKNEKHPSKQPKWNLSILKLWCCNHQMHKIKGIFSGRKVVETR